MAKLPTYTGNGTKLVRVNSAGTALEAVSTLTAALVISGTDNSEPMLRITQLGTADAFEVGDATDPDATPFIIDASGNVITGHTAKVTQQTLTDLRVQIHGAGGGASTMGIAAYGTTAANGPMFQFNRSRDTTIGAVATIVQDGDELLEISAGGADGAAFIPAASIRVQVDGTPGTNDMPGRILFSVTADGASSVSEAMRISQDKSVLCKGALYSDSATAGVGYTTGAGGTVSQGTSKSTGVTLNKVTGKITMHSASLAASTSVSFTLTNSTIADTDLVDVCIVSGATAASYTVGADAVASGSCRIHVRNTSGGALAEAIVLRFAVKKSVDA